MARHWKIVIALLGVCALAGALTFPSLLHNVLGLRRATVTEEQARRAITEPSISTPSDTRAQAQLFWASLSSAGTLEPSTVSLPLSADPVQRGRQLINALIVQAPTTGQRTLPADAELLQFYLLPDGTAVADFSDTLSGNTPSGILSEQLVVDSIAHTLGANISGVTRLKILIRGEETDTLAGHLDLTGFFPVPSPALPDSAISDSAAGTPPDAGAITPGVAGLSPVAGTSQTAPAAQSALPASPGNQ